MLYNGIGVEAEISDTNISKPEHTEYSVMYERSNPGTIGNIKIKVDSID